MKWNREVELGGAPAALLQLLEACLSCSTLLLGITAGASLGSLPVLRGRGAVEHALQAALSACAPSTSETGRGPGPM